MESTTSDTVASAELRDRVARGGAVTIIDVRSSAEFESVHIRGAYHVPLPLLAEHTKDLAERLGGDVVLVCQSGTRAAEARKRLAAVGLADAAILAGGIAAYEAAGGEVVRGVQRWAMDRQVRMAAGSLVLVGALCGKFLSPRLQYVPMAVGAGLAYSALTNSCAMAAVLSRMPWNRATVDPTGATAIRSIPRAVPRA